MYNCLISRCVTVTNREIIYIPVHTWTACPKSNQKEKNNTFKIVIWSRAVYPEISSKVNHH